MSVNPFRLFEEFKEGIIDKSSLLNLLISIIEEHSSEEQALESFKILHKIESKEDILFNFLENLITSDERESIRSESISYLNKFFLHKSLNLFKWAIIHEKSYTCLFKIIQSIAKINTNDSKQILIDKLKKIRKTKYINTDKGYENRKFRKGLKILFKSNEIRNISHKQLSEIIINYLTVEKLIETLPNVFFEINHQCLIVELDLSDYLEYEVKGTPWGWKNNIETLSSITNLENLSNLQKLNLSNNHIKDLKDLVKLKNLNYIDLSNNKISNPQNIEYLKQMALLEHVDLRGNAITNIINTSDFNPKIRILNESSLENMEKRLEMRFEK